jgi:hypothetical protein
VLDASPAAVTLDPVEVWRVQRVRIAERLNITPGQVDDMDYADVCDLLEVWRADKAIQERHAAQQRRAAARRGRWR